MISVSEIYGSINMGFSCSRQEVGNEQKRIMILFGDLIKTSEVDTEAESSVFLFDKKDGGSMQRGCRSDETGTEMFLNSQRVWSSTLDSRYIGVTGGAAPSSKSIFKS